MERLAQEYQDTAQLLLTYRQDLAQRRALLMGDALLQLDKRMALLRDEAQDLRRTARLLARYHRKKEM